MCHTQGPLSCSEAAVWECSKSSLPFLFSCSGWIPLGQIAPAEVLVQELLYKTKQLIDNRSLLLG